MTRPWTAPLSRLRVPGGGDEVGAGFRAPSGLPQRLGELHVEAARLAPRPLGFQRLQVEVRGPTERQGPHRPPRGHERVLGRPLDVPGRSPVERQGLDVLVALPPLEGLRQPRVPLARLRLAQPFDHGRAHVVVEALDPALVAPRRGAQEVRQAQRLEAPGESLAREACDVRAEQGRDGSHRQRGPDDQVPLLGGQGVEPFPDDPPDADWPAPPLGVARQLRDEQRVSVGLLGQRADVDAFGGRLSFFFAAHNDFLEEVAKFRAARRLWARLMRDRFGATEPRAQQLRFHTQTAGSTLTAQQPDNNIVRVALQAMAAVLGGTQSLHCNGRDEALGLPTESSAQIALRTQQVIAAETGVVNTVDPVAGSYAIESLTDAIEQGVTALLDQIADPAGSGQAADAA